VSDVVAIEDAMGRAWPALEVVRDEGWILRASGGLTRRGDSVLARPGGTSPLAERIARAEAFAAAHGERTFFQLSPASEPGLEEELVRRGYIHEALTSARVAPLAPIAGAASEVTLTEEPDADWLGLWDDAEGYGARLPLAQRILAAIDQPRAYALLRHEGEPVAQARAVADGELCGFFAVATRPTHRRRGLAAACIGALAAWGLEQGASTAYLLVQRDNGPALALYRRLGFEERFAYWYRARPA
jgi:ribosomal protein S18 acetylase RimI-like enzyme